MILEKMPEVQSLTLQDKEKLAEEIWEEIARERDTLPVPPDHLKTLEQRRKDFEKSPSEARSWETVKDSLRKQFPKNDH